MKLSKLDIVCMVLFAAFAVYGFAFVVTHGHVVLNRYTDSWWHVAAADEYAKTGVFAKDPFFEDTPPFAQFGLMDFVNGAVSRLTGLDTSRGFVWLVAFNVVVFLVATFAAGFQLHGRIFEGCLCASVSFLAFNRLGIVGQGMPFFVAVSLVYLLMASLWHGNGVWVASTFGVLWRGALLGVTFDLHAFVGLVGCVIAALSLARQFAYPTLRRVLGRERDAHPAMGVTASRKALFNIAMLCVIFLAISWPWLRMHVTLRPVLKEINAHVCPGYPVRAWSGLVLAAGIVMAILSATAERVSARSAGDHCVKREEEGSDRVILIPYLVLGAVLVILCAPAVNRAIAERTSWYMARRVPYFFPLGLVMAISWSCLKRHFALGSRAGAERFLRAGALLVALGLFVGAAVLGPSAKAVLLLHAYLVRTDDLDRHRYAYLREEVGDAIAGRTAVSDPTTSYFARGMVGTYTITVPSGHASPAVDYVRRDALARRLLREGPADLQDAASHVVIVDKRQNTTSRFAGCPANQIIKAWRAQGWSVLTDTERAIVLARAPFRTVAH